MRKSFLQAVKDTGERPQDMPHPNGMSFGALQMKPFKAPVSTRGTARTRKNATATTSDGPDGANQVKRSRVVFTENDFYATALDHPLEDGPPKKKAKKAKGKENDDSDDDDGGAKAQKNKFGFVDRYVAPPKPKQFPVYRPKANSLETKFRLPGMKKKGVLLDLKPSYKPLGTRQVGQFIPRPAHDPLEEHAIVLWDPTVDDVEARREQERLERERLERDAEVAKHETAVEKERKKFHKSLAEILGIADKDERKRKLKKVAVVIDPLLGRKLRPHQVEGVKFLYKCTTGMTDENAFGCIMADEMGLGKTVRRSSLRSSLARLSQPATNVVASGSMRSYNASRSCGPCSASRLYPARVRSTKPSSLALPRSSRTGPTNSVSLHALLALSPFLALTNTCRHSSEMARGRRSHTARCGWQSYGRRTQPPSSSMVLYSRKRCRHSRSVDPPLLLPTCLFL